MAGSASIPGASKVEGGTVACSVSDRSMALWAGVWNAQFLLGQRVEAIAVHRKRSNAYLIVEATPPLLILSLYSVNTITFANGYSRGESRCNGFEGDGVKKKARPVCDYVTVSGELWNCEIREVLPSRHSQRG